LGGATGALYRDRYWQHAQLEAVRELQKALQPRGRSLIQTAVAWVLAQPGITCAIVGASKPEQLGESLAAVTVGLEKDELKACNQAWYRLPRPMTPVR
jgi:aryl-alcohol dehydrogenase-like predicted oxidoreductase